MIFSKSYMYIQLLKNTKQFTLEISYNNWFIEHDSFCI